MKLDGMERDIVDEGARMVEKEMLYPQLSLDKKVAVITGAVGGIGRAIVEVFLAAGANVFLTDLRESSLTELSGTLKRRGIETPYKAIDLTLSGSAKDLVGEVIRKMGKIDILVNSAGISKPSKPEEETEENWDDIFNINLKGMFFLCQAVGREMIKKGEGGRIVNISSQAGSVAVTERVPYCSSKGGVNQLTRTLALDWAVHNINVNAVAPTFVLTDLTRKMFEDEEFKKYVLSCIPLARLANPEDIAYAVLFLCSDFAKMITGHVLAVDGGWTIQ